MILIYDLEERKTTLRYKSMTMRRRKILLYDIDLWIGEKYRKSSMILIYERKLLLYNIFYDKGERKDNYL